MTVIPQILENQLAIMKQTLDFYANIDNYENSLIQSDKGFLAKHALATVQTLTDQNKAMSDDYAAFVSQQKVSEIDVLAEANKIMRELENE